MKKIKYIIALIIFIQSAIMFAQDYKFIDKELHLMTSSEMVKQGVQLTSDLAMFDVDGNKIASDQLNDIMMSGNFMPVFFANKSSEPKAIVFRATNKEEKKQMQAVTAINPNSTFKAGEMAYDFDSVDLQGKKVTLNNYKNKKVVVLNFWFTDCAPCVAEMPELNKIVEKYKNKEVEFLAVTFDSKEKLNQFFKSHKFDYRIISDMQIIKDYNISTFPLNMIIDQNGEIIFKKVGPFLKEMDTKIGMSLDLFKK